MSNKAGKQQHKKTRTIIVSVLIVLVLMAAGVYYLVYVVKPAAKKPDPNNVFTQQVQNLLSQPVPDDPISKAIFYAQVAQNYDGVHDTANALTYYLKAQAVIDQNKLSDQIVYYQAIADDYQASGDKAKTRSYLQLQLDHLNQYAKANPDDEATQAAIKAVKDRLAAL